VRYESFYKEKEKERERGKEDQEGMKRGKDRDS
jgi:hypothetical protein